MTPLNNLPGTSPLTRSVCHVPPPSTTPLFLCYASSPFATLPFLVQWRVKERSRAKGAQQTPAGSARSPVDSRDRHLTLEIVC